MQADHGEQVVSLRAFLDAIPIAALLWHHVADDFVLVHLNSAAVELIDDAGPRLVDRSSIEIYGEDSAIVTDLRQCVTTGAQVDRECTRPAVAGGPVRHLALTYGYVAPGYVVMSVRDRTAEHESRAAALEATEQRAWMHRLQESEARFRRIAELSKSTILTFMLDEGRFEYVSPAVEQMSGYRPAEFYAQGLELVRRLVHPDDAHLIDDPGPLTEGWTTVRWRHRDGRDVWTQQHLTPIRDSQGRTIGWQGEARDVTEERTLESELRQLAEIVETTPNAIFTTDAENRIITWNQGAVAMFGWTPEEIRGVPAYRIVPPEHADEGRTNFALTQAGHSREIVTQRWRADGSRLDVALSVSPRWDPSGEFAGAAVIARDISESKRQERELMRLAAVIDSSADAIFAVASSGRVLTWNRGAEATFGFSRQEAVGADLSELLRGDEEAELTEALRQASAGRAVVAKGRVRRADGQLIDVSLTVSAMEGGDGISVVGHDITASLQAARSAQRLQEQLAQTQRLESIAQLAGGIAHDLNNLLGVLRLHGEFALDELEADHPARAEVERMRAATERAAEVTNQLLAFSRREVRRTERLDVAELLSDVGALLERLLGPDIELGVEVTGQPLAIDMDRGLFEQVILNLATNARDAMPDGGALRIAATASEDGTEVMLTVADTGQGMDETVRRQIFEPFFTTKPRGKGTGLGLSTVWTAVARSGGRVNVESTPGEGTCFAIILPRAGAGPLEHPTEHPAPRGGSTGHPSILIVDDEEEIAALAARVLRSHGYTVRYVTEPGQALALIQDAAVRLDLLVTDVVMPRISGVEVAAAAATLRPVTPVVFMSGDVKAVDRLAPGTIVVRKPFSATDLSSAVAAALRGRRAAADG